MLSNKTPAAYLLRLYAWEMLEQNGALNLITIKGKPKIPVIPVNDEPEYRDSGKAYIIYGWSENEENNVRPIQRGNISFRIIAEDSNQLNHITSILARGMEDEEETATSINWWSTSHTADLKGIRFTWVKTVLVESADAADTEGGQVEGTVIVGYRYVSSQEVITFKPGTTIAGTDGAWQ